MRSTWWLKSFVNFALLMINGKSWSFKEALAAPEMFSDTNTFIEHEVTAQQAKQASQQIEPHTMIGAGCKECSRVEMEYCLSTDVLSDHCCCDRKYREIFPYMEHTCPFEENTCQPIARDCSEYVRIADCCCHKYLAHKWKMNYSKSRANSVHYTPILSYFYACINLLILLNKYRYS